jgi:hypothetical protein
MSVAATRLIPVPSAAEKPESAVRRFSIAIVLLWTLVATSLRAVRLPNDFSKGHWLIDYRFGFVKRGLVGELLTLATRAVHARPTDQLIGTLASIQYIVFCLVVAAVSLRMIARARWATDTILLVMVFVSSPFIVMSAHLIGYYDNIIIVMTMASLLLLAGGRCWQAAVLQAVAILVHENALLVGFPALCGGWWLLDRRMRQQGLRRLSLWPLLLPVVTFVALWISQSLAPQNLEDRLTAQLARFPFIATNLPNTRVPHWITITFADSYRLHQGQFAGRLFSLPMLGLVLPSTLACLGFVVDAYGLPVASIELLLLMGVCLAPQSMHLVAWDTARIWTYSVLTAFLMTWLYSELFPSRLRVSAFVQLLALIALVLNAAELTPLMDGLKDHFDLTVRLLMYAPALGATALLIMRDGSKGDL